MTTIGIKELKANLSRYVQKAASGESIMVTDRGTPVAILSPVPSEIKLANQLADAGVARWTGKNFSPTPLSELPKRRTKKGPSLSEIVTREREESW